MARPAVRLGVSGASFLVLTTLAGAALAGDRETNAARCMAYSSDGAAIQGVDACLNFGSHVRVEAQVMQGAGSLSAGLPGVFAGAGPAPAAAHPEPTTRLRMGPSAGDRVISR